MFVLCLHYIVTEFEYEESRMTFQFDFRFLFRVVIHAVYLVVYVIFCVTDVGQIS